VQMCTLIAVQLLELSIKFCDNVRQVCLSIVPLIYFVHLTVVTITRSCIDTICFSWWWAGHARNL